MRDLRWDDDDRRNWGAIAAHAAAHQRQCFYFSEEDIYFALMPRGERRLVEALAKIGSDVTPRERWQDEVWERLK